MTSEQPIFFFKPQCRSSVVNLLTYARNAAIADMQPVLRVCANAMTWVTYTHSPCVTCRIWSFCVKGCKHKYRGTPKLMSAETPLSWDGRRGCPQDTSPSPNVLPRQIWYATKGVRINRKKPQIPGQLEAHPFSLGAWLAT